MHHKKVNEQASSVIPSVICCDEPNRKAIFAA